MSYLALYRRWRPKQFTDVVGQHHVSDTLQRAIREDKVAHAYLFAGPRGTGKTSMAKIFARAINCEQGPTDTPCGVCESCQQMLQGQALDVIEIDAASNRGIDEVRALREQVNFLPVVGHKKVFIIDEAHMLTNEAWNALLKTIEEPPKHVMFIFATTESEKLPVTILSRCQRYTFRRITAKDITAHLLHIAELSDISLDPAAAQVIAVHADGGLRDALSILDQCSGMTSETITAPLVETMIGLVSKSWVLDMVDILKAGNGAALLQAVDEALQMGRDARQIVTALVEHLRAMIVAKVLPDAEELLAYDTHKERLLEQTNAVAIEEIGRYINVLQAVQNNAKQVENPRVIVEMGLLSLLQLGGGSYQTLEGRLTTVERFVNRQEDVLFHKLSEWAEQRPVAPVAEAMGQPEHIGTVGTKAETVDDEWGAIPEIIEDMPTKQAVSTIPTAPSGQAQTGTTEASKGMRLGPPAKQTVPPTAKQMLPPPGKQMAPPSVKQPLPPPKAGAGLSLGSTVKAKAPSQEVQVGQNIVNPHEYSTIFANVIKWLRGHNCGLLQAMYQQGKLVYLDQERAVLVFSTAVAVPILTQPRHMQDGSRAFQQVAGHAVPVEPMDKNDPRVQAYVKAAAGGTAQPAQATHKPVTPPVKEPAPQAMASPVSPVATVPVEEKQPSVEPVKEGLTTEEKTIEKPQYVETVEPVKRSKKGAGSAPTNAEGIVDDFLTVYENPEAVLNPYYEEEIAGHGGTEIRNLPKWNSAEASDEEKADSLIYDALQHMESHGYDIYVEEVDETSKS